MLGDLHVHTRYSDGSYTPDEAVAEALRRGLDYISFVDHDTVDQTASVLDAVRRAGSGWPGAAVPDDTAADGGCGHSPGRRLRIVPGVEISAYDFGRERKAHILGYGYDQEARAVRTLCDPLIRRRNENTLRQIEAVRKAGYPVDEDEVRLAAGGADRWLYKQHIMLVLIRKGLAETVYCPLYREFFKAGGICPWDIEYVDARDAVRAVLDDGGIPVLAHPGQTGSWDLLPELADAGLAGIEFYHEDHGKTDYPRILEAARRYGLILTGGSDDHGDWGSVHRMGEIRAPFGSLDALIAHGAARLPRA